MTSTTTSTAPATTHTFIVGSSNGTLAYNPTNITAHKGDTVIFSFRAKNHTITRSNFGQPCVPLQLSANETGFFSGFGLSVGEFQSDNFPTVEIVINDTEPIWFYCSQTNHCVNGMVGSINANPDGNMSFADFQHLAINSGIKQPIIPPIQSSEKETLFVAPMSLPGNATASSTSTAPATTHTIAVGNSNGSLTYNPPNISASVGDIVRYSFMPKNHSVTQSSFQQPCVPLGASENIAGIWSGFNPVSDNETDRPYFDILINDTKPIWFYCSQTNHCMHGMVGSINAEVTGNATFAQFQTLAMNSGISLPVLPLLVTGGFSSIYGWPGMLSSMLSAESTTTATAASPERGALIGIIVGAVALAVFSVLGVYCFCCRRRRSREVSGSQAGGERFTGYGTPSYRRMNDPAPEAAVDMHHAYDDEPLVGSQRYSTAWDADSERK